MQLVRKYGFVIEGTQRISDIKMNCEQHGLIENSLTEYQQELQRKRIVHKPEKDDFLSTMSLSVRLGIVQQCARKRSRKYRAKFCER